MNTLSRAFELFDDDTSSSSGSSSSGSNWNNSSRTTYGQSGHLYRTGDGKAHSIGLDDGSEIYVYDESNGRVQNQYGDLWNVYGNTVLRV